MRGRSVARQVALVVACLPLASMALPGFLDDWRSRYPASTSDDLECQTCHVNPTGNTPWNAYGIDVMQVYYAGGQSDIDEAMELVEGFDSDGDGDSNITEINNNEQPGWSPGPTNDHFDGQNNMGVLNVTVVSSNNSPPAIVVSDPIPGDIPQGMSPVISLALHEVTGGLTAPVRAIRAPGINGSLFVVEQAGRVIRVDLTSGEQSVFLNISGDLVGLNGGFDERGLLGLAFHPQFASNGRFYTYQSIPVDGGVTADYSTTASPNHRSAIVEYRASDPSCNSFVRQLGTLLLIDQPQFNHNGGDITFGPDGYLYIAVGDGGNASDLGPGHGTTGNGQDPTNPLGAILRIDVDGGNSPNGQYGIPASNPFVGQSGLDEIFAYGFRNPYRISFDAVSGTLYAGDVGQGDIEEVDVVTAGGNYGWNWKEGSFYFLVNGGTPEVSQDPPPGSPTSGLVDPLLEYDHDEGISVIGGYVYRGTDIAVLNNHYVFADWSRIGGASGNRRLLYANLGLTTPVINEFFMDSLGDNVTGFGQDVENELYITTNTSASPFNTNGRLLKLMLQGDSYAPPANTGESAQCPFEDEICLPIKATGSRKTIVCM